MDYQAFLTCIAKRMTVTSGGCWEWVGSHTADGYSNMTFEGKSVHLHRMMCFIFNGPIDGLDVHHKCENPGCFNPHHLTAITRRDHTVNLTPNSTSFKNTRATHCPHGHKYNLTNTRVLKNGNRACRECHLLRSRNITRNSEVRKSPYRGVSWSKHRGKWEARVSLGTAGSSVAIGCFDDDEEAAYVRDQCVLQLNLPQTKLNLTY